LTDVNEAAEKFREQIKTDSEKVSACDMQNLQKFEVLGTNLGIVIETIASTQKKISQQCDQLISLIQLHQSQLMEKLGSYKTKIVKKLETERDEIERQLVITESFKRYCQEIISKGTACEISRMAHDLHARAEELMKTQDQPVCHQLSGAEITFTPTVVTTDSIKNLIGELVLKGQFVDR